MSRQERPHARRGETNAFLRWALPRARLRAEGFANMRGTLHKRLMRRLAELGLADLDAYRARLEEVPQEWLVLDRMCRIPISRFYRDEVLYRRIAGEILPGCAARAAREGRRAIRVWSAGCASGEEPYTIALVFHLLVAPSHPDVALELIATDVEPTMLARAERRAYDATSVRELPSSLRAAAFERDVGDRYRLREELTKGVSFRLEDMRLTMPDGPFDLVLCRNAAFTYFDRPTQHEVAAGLVARLRPGGTLVIAPHEELPAGLGLRDTTFGVFEKPAVTSSPEPSPEPPSPEPPSHDAPPAHKL